MQQVEGHGDRIRVGRSLRLSRSEGSAGRLALPLIRCAIIAAAAFLLPPFFTIRASAADARIALMEGALGHWQLGDGGVSAKHPLKQTGRIELGIAAEGDASRVSATVARVRAGYFDAGPGLNVTGDQITVFLRVRDPFGQWMHALMAKRGTHETINFNLFSADLDRTQGPDIGFEVHTDAGLVMVSFPLSEVHPEAWHDLVARYDGKRVELICDGVVMDRRRWKGNLTQNREPLLIGAQSDNGEAVAAFTGDLEEAAVWSRALTDDEVAAISRKEKLMSHPKAPEAAEPYRSPIHYQPPVGKMGDTIPFYWNSEYHVFYIRAMAKMPWAHIVSTDLVHWVDLPTAIIPDGDPLGPHGENIGTGSVIETGGVFHAFFTGWNPRNPAGREVAAHAVSTNLIEWTKVPGDVCAPDGVIYKNHKDRDFRDPYVFWNEEEQCWWLLIFANEAKTGGTVIGVFTSKDLKAWTAQPPIANLTGQECPDYFRIGDLHYLLGGFRYYYAEALRGPYQSPRNPYLDTPILYAGKRMFDGKRHVWTAWFRDLAGERDGGAMEWGGPHQCVPRELYPGPRGELYAKPVDEVTAHFTKSVLDLASQPPVSPSPRWAYEEGRLVGASQRLGSQQVFDVPDHYMMTATVTLDPAATLTVVLREQPDSGDGYRLVLRPAQGEAEINGPGFSFARRCAIDASRPVKIQAFVLGTMIETFINDAYAFSCRAYNFPKGALGINVAGGTVRIEDLNVRVSTAPVP
jgi:beta-fructofuranosidase